MPSIQLLRAEFTNEGWRVTYRLSGLHGENETNTYVVGYEEWDYSGDDGYFTVPIYRDEEKGRDVGDSAELTVVLTNIPEDITTITGELKHGITDGVTGVDNFDTDTIQVSEREINRANVRNLACTTENPPQESEVLVDVKEGNEWIRIPVTLCELRVNKDGPADISRTAKVKFPAEWGGNNITQYINGFDSENDVPYDECRIWFYDHSDGVYQVAHYGYIGGVGPATESGVMKFWVYDPADLMRRIKVSESFGEPTVRYVLNFALRGTDDNGRPVGLEHHSVFQNIRTKVIGADEKVPAKGVIGPIYGRGGGVKGDVTADGDYKFSVGPYSINLNDTLSNLFNVNNQLLDMMVGGQKRFQVNRHNMVDLMDWFASEVNGKWHFEPTPNGPVLVFDNVGGDGSISRRLFMDDELSDEEITENDDGTLADIVSEEFDSAFETVDVLDNNALYDIKPFNTLELYGESTPHRNRHESMGAAGAPGAYTEQYPYVKVKYPPLVERSGGYEYTAPSVESDKVYIEQAVNEAKKEFRHHLEEETEGHLEILGEPYILPYDHITTIPTCNDTYPNADMQPITYEVNSVIHRRSAGERYKSRLGVSLTYDESDLVVEKEYRKA